MCVGTRVGKGNQRDVVVVVVVVEVVVGAFVSVP